MGLHSKFGILAIITAREGKKPVPLIKSMCYHSVMSDSANPWTVSLPGSSLHGILQARILEWVAMPSSRGSFPPRNGTKSPALQVDSLPSEPPGKHSEIHILMQFSLYFVVNKIVEIYACVCA